ncbi:MBL fold metallo-hydrolase [Paenibacillus methanolicus]|uniref:Glyoxylase-like metal-dependent hydrolase (Beta-lactamase superfamily II) n=1 Tax=Paenibacillus methanolicus TaxID=582686 RepID=A0A5S5CF26_9BACL|nr:MBL fold metallo-hydrolase [Paenibacillus methanolicus]TYP76603.1 glyoxylase-like metal-dependent hydrolase (beta-lactamase superfamily II) [Paenibacillus methanolicus]
MRIIHKLSVYQLTFLPRFFPVNAYLVEEEDGLTVIDAALPYSAKGILQAAARIGKPITRIALTHAHGDHIGALDALKAALPRVPVFISARDARLLDGDRSLDAHEPQGSIRGDVPKAGKIKTKPDVLLQDGDRVGSLLAVAAPGHTPGHMAFLDTRSRALLAGDALQTRGGMAVAGQLRPLFPFPAMATWNKEASFATARQLRELNPSLLGVGHGLMVDNPLAEMARAIETADRQLHANPEGSNRDASHRS